MSEKLGSFEHIRDNFIDFVTSHAEDSRNWTLDSGEELEAYDLVEFIIFDPPDRRVGEPIFYEMHFYAHFPSDGRLSHQVKGFQIITSDQESNFLYSFGKHDDVHPLDGSEASRRLELLQQKEAEGKFVPAAY